MITYGTPEPCMCGADDCPQCRPDLQDCTKETEAEFDERMERHDHLMDDYLSRK